MNGMTGGSNRSERNNRRLGSVFNGMVNGPKKEVSTMIKDYKDKKVVVTGAANGIGRELALG